MEHEQLTSKIIAAAIQVHRRLGPGFLESIYENALVLELRAGGLKVHQQLELIIKYAEVEVGRHRLDLLVEERIVVELKAVQCIESVHFAIVKSYLKAANLQHALILNFARPVLEVKRARVSDLPAFLASS